MGHEHDGSNRTVTGGSWETRLIRNDANELYQALWHAWVSLMEAGAPYEVHSKIGAILGKHDSKYEELLKAAPPIDITNTEDRHAGYYKEEVKTAGSIRIVRCVCCDMPQQQTYNADIRSATCVCSIVWCKQCGKCKKHCRCVR
jgi:hypothetical protein